jgi:hypothetical protein
MTDDLESQALRINDRHYTGGRRNCGSDKFEQVVPDLTD